MNETLREAAKRALAATPGSDAAREAMYALERAVYASEPAALQGWPTATPPETLREALHAGIDSAFEGGSSEHHRAQCHQAIDAALASEPAPASGIAPADVDVCPSCGRDDEHAAPCRSWARLGPKKAAPLARAVLASEPAPASGMIFDPDTAHDDKAEEAEREAASTATPPEPGPRDIAARIWRDHYLGGGEDNDLGPIDDTDRADADSVIAALSAAGIALSASPRLATLRADIEGRQE